MNSNFKLFAIAISCVVVTILIWQTWHLINNPIDFWLDGLKGLIVSIYGTVIGFYIFNKYFLPAIMSEMGRNTLKDLGKDPEIKPLLDKAKNVMTRLEPIVEKFKNVDVDKLNGDLQPIIAQLRKIDVAGINETIGTVKELAKSFKKPEKLPELPPENAT